mgnify:CR=1 FL=1
MPYLDSRLLKRKMYSDKEIQNNIEYNLGGLIMPTLYDGDKFFQISLAKINFMFTFVTQSQHDKW